MEIYEYDNNVSVDPDLRLFTSYLSSPDAVIQNVMPDTVPNTIPDITPDLGQNMAPGFSRNFGASNPDTMSDFSQVSPDTMAD